jgi:HAE1 family hydrophobic/amphiphilic exporter-1/multidrug efflux pump
MYVKNNKGDLIQMDNIVVSKSKANHHSYTITIALWQLLFLRVCPGKSISDGIEAMEQIRAKVLTIHSQQT